MVRGQDEYLDLRQASTADDREAADDEYGDEDEDDDGTGAAWLVERLPRLVAMFLSEPEPLAESDPEPTPSLPLLRRIAARFMPG